MLCGRQGATHLKPKKRPGSAKGFTKARGTPTGRRSRSCKGSKPLFIILFTDLSQVIPAAAAQHPKDVQQGTRRSYSHSCRDLQVSGPAGRTATEHLLRQ